VVTKKAMLYYYLCFCSIVASFTDSGESVIAPLEFKSCFVHIVIGRELSVIKAFLRARSGRLVEVSCLRLRQGDKGLLVHLIITTKVKPLPG
jgi:hypothetical protein